MAKFHVSIKFPRGRGLKQQNYGRMLKRPGFKFSVLHISVVKCKFWSDDDNIGQKLKEPSFVILGE